MVIECAHCGAPLDVKQHDQFVKCAYCAMSNQVRASRTVSFETPPGWRPPAQWLPPPHVAADSAKILTYHAVKGVRTAASIVTIVVVSIVIAAGLGAVGVVVAVMRQTSSTTRDVNDAIRTADEAIKQAMAEASAAQAEANGALKEGLAQVPGAGKNPGASSLSLLTNAGVAQALAAYKRALGVSSLKAMRLTLHETHSSIELQSPKNPAHVDGYSYSNGAVTGPEAKRLSDREKTKLETFLFDPEKGPLLKMDSLRQTAISKLAYEQAKITHVIVDRDRGKTEILVYCSSPRDSGYVSFDDKGGVVRVARF
jgi:hypothetical protein